ncbi:hypothetical protein PZA11_006795 [Diplocarpon coronariae]
MTGKYWRMAVGIRNLKDVGEPQRGQACMKIALEAPEEIKAIIFPGRHPRLKPFYKTWQKIFPSIDFCW